MYEVYAVPCAGRIVTVAIVNGEFAYSDNWGKPIICPVDSVRGNMAAQLISSRCK